MRINVCNRFLLRVPILPLKNRALIPVNPTNEEMYAFIRSTMAIPVFRAAIFSASPVLFKSLTDCINVQAPVSTKTLKKLYASTLQYYLRAISRTTPYGLFVGVSLGIIGDKDDIICFNSSLWQPCVELDTTWLSKIIQAIEDSDDADSHILYSFNKNLYICGSRLINPHNAYKVYSDSFSKELTSIRYTVLIQKLTSHFKNILFTFSDLFDYVVNLYPDVSREKVRDIFSELRRKQYVISVLQPPLVNTVSLDYLIKALQNCNYTNSNEYFALTDLRDQLFSLSSKPIHSFPEKASLCIDTINTLDNSAKEKLQYNIKIKPYHNSLSKKTSDSLQKSLEELITFCWGYTKPTAINKFIFNFLDKYGYYKEVSLLEALDSVVGVSSKHAGVITDFCARERDPALQKVIQSYLLAKVLNTKTNRIDLTASDLQSIFGKNMSSVEPHSFSLDILCHPICSPTSVRFCFSPFVAAQQGLKTVRRFSRIFDANDVNGLKQCTDDIQNSLPADSILVECHESSNQPRIDNLSNGISSCKYSVTIGTNPSSEMDDLPLSDFFIGVDSNQKIYIVSNSLGKRIVFYFPNMINPMLQSDISNFLIGISANEELDFIYFIQDIANLPIPHMPEITYGPFILCREHWTLDINVQNYTFETFDRVFREKINQLHIPSSIEFGVSDRRMEYDLEDVIQRELIFKDALNNKSKQIVLTKGISPDSQFVKDELNNRYTSELVFSIYSNEQSERNNEPETSTSKILETRSPYKKNSRKYSILSPERIINSGVNGWWCFKLYYDSNTINQTISSLNSWCRHLIAEKKVRQYFFIRYSDPDSHLRIRLQMNDNYNSSHIVYDFIAWFDEQMDQHRVSTYCICPYERDLERYGGPSVYQNVEEVFCTNSILVGDYFSFNTSSNIERDVLFGLWVISNIFRSCGFTLNEQETILSNRFSQKSFRNEYRKQRELFISTVATEPVGHFNDPKYVISEKLTAHLESVQKYWMAINELDSRRQLTNSKHDILFSLIHMFCNRLFGNNNLERMTLCLLRHATHDIWARSLHA